MNNYEFYNRAHELTTLYSQGKLSYGEWQYALDELERELNGSN